MSTIIDYEVGQVPVRPLALLVKGDYDNTLNLNTYTTFEVELLGSDNERIDTSGVELQTEGARNGRLAVIWPKNKSLFNKRGEYLLRIKCVDSQGRYDYTRPQAIYVREFGRLKK